MRSKERDEPALGAGSDAEFAEFMAGCSRQLYRTAYLLTACPHAAEDLVQTALVKSYVAWRRVRRAHDPLAYVNGVLIKTFLSDRRRRSSKELPIAEVPEQTRPPVGGDPTERVALMTALARLAPLDRAVVVLRFWEDRSVAQTAADLHLSQAAVKNRSLRALRTLRSLLAESTTIPNGSPS
ncbi:SigE family RNA polymerase sigma factor [Nocardioides sambongensis]|uniref:SigE family RNA polymerase sigma factor n=1 Tax=Nocardioides sambongensis TaxID=2589074 RepID=UPI001E346A75|nr:SigE family RNA polymerase sigma factor [Nocardioides sambongensis]